MKYNNGFNNIDLICYINLTHRTDRLEHIETELKKTNIDEEKIHRIEAVHAPDFGILGCGKSHILALEYFINSLESNKTCLILEDDFVFTESQETVNELVNNVFNELTEFDVVMFSSNTKSETKSDYNFVTKIVDSQTLSGYMVHRNFAETLLQNYKEGICLLESSNNIPVYAVDIYMKILQPISKWYCLFPKVGKQMSSYSDIEKYVVDYNC